MPTCRGHIPVLIDISSSRCRSNQNTIAFRCPFSITSSLSIVSLPRALLCSPNEYSNTFLGFVRHRWSISESRIVSCCTSHLCNKKRQLCIQACKELSMPNQSQYEISRFNKCLTCTFPKGKNRSHTPVLSLFQHPYNKVRHLEECMQRWAWQHAFWLPLSPPRCFHQANLDQAYNLSSSARRWWH